MNTSQAQQPDLRPGLAIGHVDLLVTNVPQAVDYFVQLGMRHIHHDQEFAVLKLRGGTHLVLETPEAGETVPPGQTPPFDIMVDDIQTAHKHSVQLGMKPTEIETGRIHDNFYLDGPDGYKIRVTSSHTSGRPV